MRQGFRVIDSDTHVNPSLDVLLRYADKELQQRIDDLQPYRRTVKTVSGRGDAEDVGSATILSLNPPRLQRVSAANAAPAAAAYGPPRLLFGPAPRRTPNPNTPRLAETQQPARHR